MINKKSKLTFVIIMAVMLLSLFVLGSVFDLAISQKIYDGADSLPALLGGIFGKLPAFLLLAYAFAVMLNYVANNADAYKKGVKITLYIVYTLAILVSFILAFYSAFEDVTSKAKYIAVVGGAIATCILAIVAYKDAFPKLEEQKKWAVLTIIAIGIIIVLVVAIKTLWGRTRYNTIMDEGGTFSPWYKPEGIHGGHSFPSGHTALWGALFMVLPLFAIFGYRGANATCALIIVMDLLIALSRIVGGHHYLTDVTLSMIIAFSTTFVTMHIGYGNDYSKMTLSEKSIFRKI